MMLSFLATVAARLPSLVGDGLNVIEVRIDRSRDWLRAEARFRVQKASLYASAFVPLDSDWRYLSGYEHVDDYAGRLASETWAAARAVMFPSDRPTPATGPADVAARWQWLLERLVLHGQVVQRDDGSLRVIREEGGDFTVLVTPEQWAQIAEPLDPNSDDPQDFNQLSDEEAFLVFYEHSLEWSMRPELPPVPFGAVIKRSFREAKERGEDMSQYGWFAHRAQDDQLDRYDDGAE